MAGFHRVGDVPEHREGPTPAGCCGAGQGCSTAAKTILVVGGVMVALGITLASLQMISPAGAGALIGIGTPLLSIGAMVGIHQMEGDEERKARITMIVAGVLLVGGITALSIIGLPPWAVMTGHTAVSVASGLIIFSVVAWAHAKARREMGPGGDRGDPLFVPNPHIPGHGFGAPGHRVGGPRAVRPAARPAPAPVAPEYWTSRVVITHDAFTRYQTFEQRTRLLFGQTTSEFLRYDHIPAAPHDPQDQDSEQAARAYFMQHGRLAGGGVYSFAKEEGERVAMWVKDRILYILSDTNRFEAIHQPGLGANGAIEPTLEQAAIIQADHIAREASALRREAEEE